MHLKIAGGFWYPAVRQWTTHVYIWSSSPILSSLDMWIHCNKSENGLYMWYKTKTWWGNYNTVAKHFLCDVKVNSSQVVNNYRGAISLMLQTLTVFFRYVCIRGVFILTTECTSLTVTLVVTLRKFISLIFSILYFQNPFTGWHWVGTAVVFIGTLLYTEVWSSVQAALRGGEVKQKKAE